MIAHENHSMNLNVESIIFDLYSGRLIEQCTPNKEAQFEFETVYSIDDI